MNPLSIELRTQLLVRSLASGNSTVAPASSLGHTSFGRESESLSEQKIFLAEHLSRVAPEAVAHFNLPDGVRIVETEVLLTREDLPRRQQVRTPVQVHSLVIPSGKDAWVIVVPLDHTFYVRADDPLDAAIRSEVERLVAARELKPLEYLRLLPPRALRLVPMELSVERVERLPPGKVASLRKALQERERRKWATEILNSVATAMHTRTSRHAPPLVAREGESRQVASLLDSKKRHASLIYGPSLAGKSALVREWLRARLARDERVPVYATSASQLIAGMSGLGQWEERVRRVLEAAEALDAVLWFDNLGDMLTEQAHSSVDIPSAIKPWLEEGRVRVVGELRADLLDVAERRHGGFLGCFSRVRVDPLDAKQTAQALQSRVDFERRHHAEKPRLRSDAVHTLIDLAERYLPYQAFPGKAFKLYDELRTIHENAGSHAARSPELTPTEVHEVFSLQSGIPAFLLRDDAALRLGDVVARLRQRLVGQEAAVRRVAEVVCVVKARMQPAGKPLATLLFVGPTGVGKTELARAVAALLFGSEDRMVRFDMSEFTDVEAADRLIRGSHGAEGLLTRRIREQPFGVVLLDEVEKAHPAVFDLLLQVCGEGRLTDGRGRTAYFHNAILIMTSNLGAAHERDALGFTRSAHDPTAYYQREVDRTFRPEFVNRLDRIVAFLPLTSDEVRRVASIALERIASRRGLAEQGVRLVVTDAAVDHLVRGGYSERYGARALRRHLEDHLVVPVARMLSRLGASVPRVAVHVSAPGETLLAPEEAVIALREEAGGLVFVVYNARSAAAERELHGVERIAGLRREVDRWMELHRVEAVREQIDHLVTSIGYGSDATDAPNADRRTSAEIAELQSEHYRLHEAWTALTLARDELYTLEEVALIALFEHADNAEFAREAEAVMKRLRVALCHVLLVQERRRDAITLLVTELDDNRGFERWLLPLYRDLERRGWSATSHIDAEPLGQGEEWPADRRWGPPRSPEEMLTRLGAPERPVRNVLVRVSGPWAGALLALEVGLHRWHLDDSNDDARRVHLAVKLLGLRAAVPDKAWNHKSMLPESLGNLEERRKVPTVRDRDAKPGEVRVPGGGAVAGVFEQNYFDRLEDVTLEHLLWYERDDAPERDALFEGSLDVGNFT